MADKKYRQVELSSDSTYLVCWLESDPRIKRGVGLTLKEIPDVTWTVRTVYSTELEGSQRKTWRVGGLL